MGAQCAAMDAARISARYGGFNPYWEVNGVTFVDRECYRTVLQNRAWGMVCVIRRYGGELTLSEAGVKRCKSSYLHSYKYRSRRLPIKTLSRLASVLTARYATHPVVLTLLSL